MNNSITLTTSNLTSKTKFISSRSLSRFRTSDLTNICILVIAVLRFDIGHLLTWRRVSVQPCFREVRQKHRRPETIAKSNLEAVSQSEVSCMWACGFFFFDWNAIKLCEHFYCFQTCWRWDKMLATARPPWNERNGVVRLLTFLSRMHWRREFWYLLHGSSCF